MRLETEILIICNLFAHLSVFLIILKASFINYIKDIKMHKFLILAIFIILQLFIINITAQKQYLRLNKTITSNLSPAKSDTFFVKMQKENFASIRVTEKEIRIHILVYDPQDSLILIVDENQMGDKEIASFFSKKSGDYKIIVNWNFSKPYSGSYTITMDKLEPAGKSAAQKAQQLIDGWYQNNAPGVAMAVIKGGKVIFKNTKGLANVEENIPIKSNSVFELASCSKQFTGLAVAMLIDQKKLALDDDIRKYIPEMPDYGNTITISNLVYHTSGIRSTDAWEFAGYTPEEVTILPMCIKFAINQKALKFKPGERFDYSNTNYNLLAEIVARVTGQPFEMWTKENIYKPLGMNVTFFKADIGQVYKNKVQCYNGLRERPNNWAAMGGAGLNTSLDDLVKWVNSFDTKQLITPGVEKLLYAEGSLRENGRTRYAFGNEYNTLFNGTKEIIHLGLVIGYRTAIIRYPDLKLAFIYMTNDNNDATYQRYPKILDLFMAGTLRESKPSLEGFPIAAKEVEKIEQEEKFQETIDLHPYEGIYASSELDCVWQLKIQNNRLIITNQKLNEVKLRNSGGDRFGYIEFVRGNDQKVVGLKILGEGIAFEKL